MAGYHKPRVPRAEREARRRAWAALARRRYGTQGPASDVRVIDPTTGEQVTTIPRRTDDATSSAPEEP